jgi:hypothetical protein
MHPEKLPPHKNDSPLNNFRGEENLSMINVVECIIIIVETDMHQDTILTTTSASTSLLRQRRHSMECALFLQPST